MRPTFIFLNIFLYGAFTVLAVVTHLAGVYSRFKSFALYVVGFVYIVGGLLLVHYGCRIIMSLAARRYGAQGDRLAQLFSRLVQVRDRGMLVRRLHEGDWVRVIG